MTQPTRSLYLPPGVLPPPHPASPQMVPPGLPFDRTFFENVLPQAIAAFSSQVSCDTPLVELLTVDGATHYVKGIAGVSDSWVALHTQAVDHTQSVAVFVAYQTVFRVAIHSCDESRRPLGFILDAGAKKPAVPALPAAAPAPAATNAARARKPKS